MISTLKGLRALIAENQEVRKQHPWAGKQNRMRLAVSSTNESVRRRTLDRLIEKGEVVAVRWDLLGEPTAWTRPLPAVEWF